MFNCFKNRKARKQKEIDDINAWDKKQREQMRIRVIELESEMFNTACPINKGDKCKRECIHFKRGEVHFYTDWIAYKLVNYIKSPSCKLWSK